MYALIGAELDVFHVKRSSIVSFVCRYSAYTVGILLDRYAIVCCAQLYR